MTLDDFQRLIRPLAARVANTVGRAVVRAVDDTKKVQELQVELLSDEVRDEVERFQPYGFTSVPEAGAEAVAVFVGGRRDHGLIVAVDDRRYRLKGLGSGEVAIYDKTGSKIVLKTNGDIEATPSSGVVKVVGDVNADGVSLKTHTHGAGGTLIDSGVAGGLVTGKTGLPS